MEGNPKFNVVEAFLRDLPLAEPVAEAAEVLVKIEWLEFYEK